MAVALIDESALTGEEILLIFSQYYRYSTSPSGGSGGGSDVIGQNGSGGGQFGNK